MMNKYQNVMPITKQSAEVSFLSKDVERICYALLAISLYENDWLWAQEKCLQFLTNENPDISGLAATCLGHIARINGQLQKGKVINALRNRSNITQISGQINDAINDIEMFVEE